MQVLNLNHKTRRYYVKVTQLSMDKYKAKSSYFIICVFHNPKPVIAMLKVSLPLTQVPGLDFRSRYVSINEFKKIIRLYYSIITVVRIGSYGSV